MRTWDSFYRYLYQGFW